MIPIGPATNYASGIVIPVKSDVLGNVAFTFTTGPAYYYNGTNNINGTAITDSINQYGAGIVVLGVDTVTNAPAASFVIIPPSQNSTTIQSTTSTISTTTISKTSTTSPTTIPQPVPAQKPDILSQIAQGFSDVLAALGRWLRSL